MTTTPRTGCYADGTNGHQHTRTQCAMRLEAYAWYEEGAGHAERAKYMKETARALRTDMSDDADEETQACLWLGIVAYHPEAWWGWHEGSFGLWPFDSEG